MISIEPSGVALTVRRTLKARPHVVYRVWTEPAYARRWSWGAHYTTTSLSIDCRVGGMWHQQIRHMDTDEIWMFEGEFREVIPNNRLVHTFHWKSDRGTDEGTSLVCIEFLPSGEGTELIITHTLLETAKQRQGTETGWNDVLNCVEHCLP